MAEKHHVVVDGSNLATEGRSLPSLRQLDEAVRAYAEEYPGSEIVVVVDASFEHRIGDDERAQLEEAELHGEVVSPPAGAIGRGDAFVLRIAERTGATVLSNDSFQEFHGEHPWLFDEGRLVGGKPVPGIGWIFTPRIPVRGPKSRQATEKAKRGAARDGRLPAPAKAAELAKAAKKAAARRAASMPAGMAPRIGDVWDPTASAPVAPAEAGLAPAEADGTLPAGEIGAARKAAKKAAEKPVKKAARKAAKKAAEKPVKKAAEKTAEKPVKKTAKKAAEKPVKKAAKKAAEKPVKKAAEKTAKKAATKPAEAGAATKPVKKAAKKVVTKPATKAAKKAATTAPPVRGDAEPAAGYLASHRPDVDPQLLHAIDEAVAEALSPPAPVRQKGGRAKGGAKPEDGDATSGKAAGKRAKRRGPSTPPPAVNEPLAFISFVATYPLGSEVEGEVVSYTSHGAMVEVAVPDGGSLACYIPLAAMAQPPPQKAREVLRRGEHRPFVLVGLDPPRRVAELAVPGVGDGGLVGTSSATA